MHEVSGVSDHVSLMNAVAESNQKGHPVSLDLELEVVVSCPAQVLIAKAGGTIKVASTVHP